MVILPGGAKTFYTYPSHMVITIYGNVGKILITYRCKNYTVYKNLEKYIKEKLILNTFNFSDTKVKTKIKQFSMRGKLIKKWDYLDIFDSEFSFEEIKKVSSGYTQSHKGFKWKIIKN